MFYAYTKEGKQVSFVHKLDYITAIKGPNFLANAPGTAAPIEKAAEPEGEVIKGIEPLVTEAEEVELIVDIVEDVKPARAKKIAR